MSINIKSAHPPFFKMTFLKSKPKMDLTEKSLSLPLFFVSNYDPFLVLALKPATKKLNVRIYSMNSFFQTKAPKNILHYLNQPAFNELLISRQKPMIDLRKHHLISEVKSKVEVQR